MADMGFSMLFPVGATFAAGGAAAYEMLQLRAHIPSMSNTLCRWAAYRPSAKIRIIPAVIARMYANVLIVAAGCMKQTKKHMRSI
jgi:hypothetical protein